ncbi:hypothetical protein MKD41_13295 [Lutibacter sp. A64]|uniref:hypothetical protein n=1 Tax=Lutibacter sp. A64 TaxID=2918526 RepID=UPI001F057372|nr:hypothetical protein [Lutibacter sp. A64]UMB53302.1 hypothetical protein MKD41_13295 [Lutibacter sp. A64]
MPKSENKRQESKFGLENANNKSKVFLIFLASLLAMMLFFMLGYFVLTTTQSISFLILTAVFIGVGFGFTIPLLNHMMLEVSTLQQQGENLGLFSMGVFGGQFLSTFINYISYNYKAIYGVASILAFIIGCIMYFLFQKLIKK